MPARRQNGRVKGLAKVALKGEEQDSPTASEEPKSDAELGSGQQQEFDEPFVQGDLDEEDGEDDSEGDEEEGGGMSEDETPGSLSGDDELLGDEFGDEEGGSGRDKQDLAQEEGGILGEEEESSDYGDEGEEQELGAGDVSGEGGSGSEGEEGEEAGPAGPGPGHQSEEDGDADSDGEDMKPGKGRTKFLEGDKGASFAKAFAKILQHKTKAKPAAATAEAAARGADQPAEGAPVAAAEILAESKSVAKRKAEEQEAAKVNRAAKKLRLEMRRRGHAKVEKKGQNPANDQKEKQLVSLATRGVVLLFNAVAKAQKQQQEAGAPGGAKAAKLNKASFLAQLRGAAAQGGAAAGGGMLGLGGAGKAVAEAEAPGWKVLQQDFSGLPGASKLKDWDREQSDSDGGAVPEKIDVNSDDDNGW